MANIEIRGKKLIEEQIKLLKLQRRGIPARSMFDDDNHGRIDKSIEVLETGLKSEFLDIRQHYDRAMRIEGDVEVLMVWDWMMCESDEKPVEGWDNLWVKKALAAGVKP